MHGGRVFNRIEDIRLEWKILGYTVGIFTLVMVFLTLGLVLLLINATNLLVAFLGLVAMGGVVAAYIKVTDKYVSPDLFYTETHAWRRYLRRCKRRVVRNY